MRSVDKLDTTMLLDNYSHWLRSQYRIKNLDTSDEVTTPFVNTIGDNIRIYVIPLNKSHIEISDDGITLQDLSLQGIDMSSSTRKNLLDMIKIDFKIDQKEDTLFVHGDVRDFPLLKQNFLSAIIRINDITNTKRPNIESLFFEEVYNYFDENDFGGLRNHPFNGNSGVPHFVNYVIPAKSSKPTRMIDLQNKLSFNQMMYSAYKFEDIQKNTLLSSGNPTKKITYSIIYNDEEDNPSTNSLKIAQQAHIDLFAWKNKEKILSLR